VSPAPTFKDHPLGYSGAELGLGERDAHTIIIGYPGIEKFVWMLRCTLSDYSELVI
jgi:hypothetical protein